MQKKVAVIVGSLRKDAYTRRLAEAAKNLAPASLTFTDVGIGDLPLYNQDLETDSPPPAWTAFRNQIAQADGVLFVTPEFNRGMPGALKNAIDVGSRPWGKSVWKGRPTAVISSSPGALGGMAAHHQLRLTMSILESPTLPGPEVYIHTVAGLFDESGQIKDEGIRKLVTQFLENLDGWIARFKQS